MPTSTDPAYIQRYAQAMQQMADLAAGLEKDDRVIACFTAAVEVLARDAPDREVRLSQLRDAFDMFIGSAGRLQLNQNMQ